MASSLSLTSVSNFPGGIGPEVRLQRFPPEGISGVMLFTLTGAGLTLLNRNDPKDGDSPPLFCCCGLEPSGKSRSGSPASGAIDSLEPGNNHQFAAVWPSSSSMDTVATSVPTGIAFRSTTKLGL